MANKEEHSFYTGDFNGTVFAFCEMVLRMDKPLAFSKPFSPEEEEELRSYIMENTQRFGLHYYLEKELLLTKLFAAVDMAEQWVYIIYARGESLHKYFELKRLESEMLAGDCYTKEKQDELSGQYGRLMGYKKEAIEKLLAGLE